MLKGTKSGKCLREALVPFSFAGRTHDLRALALGGFSGARRASKPCGARVPHDGPVHATSAASLLREAREEGGTHLVLREISWDARLTIQGNDILMDEGACILPVQGQGEAFTIRGFQSDRRLKLGLVLFGEVEDPPELISEPVGFAVTV